MRRTATFLAFLIIVFAGCGDGGGDTEGGAGTTTMTTVVATTTEEPLPVTTMTTRRAAATTTAAAVTRDCMTVAFTPISEDAASSIKATGLSCAEAEAFVRIAGRQTSSGGPGQVDVEGYHCIRVRSVQDPLPQAFYECTSGNKKVTFTRS